MFKYDEVEIYGHKIAICTLSSALNHDKIGRFALGRRKIKGQLRTTLELFPISLRKFLLLSGWNTFTLQLVNQTYKHTEKIKEDTIMK